MNIKVCTKCLETKELELFAKGSRYKDGRRSVCKKCHTQYMIEYYKKNPEKNKEKIQLNTGKSPNWKRHKLSKEQYENMVSKFDGKCYSCKERPAIAIDHDHKCCTSTRSCGKCVRGVLCSQCNTALGLLSDDEEKIKNLLEYISIYSHGTTVGM